MTKKPELFCLGASHKSAGISFREELYLNQEQLLAGLPTAKNKFNFSELAALSTCNRFEMFGVYGPGTENEQEIINAYLELQKLAEKSHNFSTDAIKSSTYFLRGKRAIQHLFSVASSLDSLIVGETQITGQFKNAIAIAKEAETLGSTLDRLAQEALGAAKKVRTQTSIGEKTVSISHAALDLSKKVFRDLSAQKILIIGTGEMGQVAAKYSVKYQPSELFIVNRSIGKAHKLAKELDYGKGYGMDELPALLAEADIVISATGAPGAVLTKKHIIEAQKKRKGRTLFLVDIAMPRDIEPECSEIDDVYLFDIDDLKQVVDENIEHRQKAAIEAETIITDVTEQFVKWLDAHAVKPAIKSYNTYLDNLLGRELERSLSKGELVQLSDTQKMAIKNMIGSIKTKMGGDVARNLNNPPDKWYKEQLADALDTLFTEKNPDQKKRKT